METSELSLFPKRESREIQHYQAKIEELDRHLLAAIGKQGELKLEIEALNKRIKRQGQLLAVAEGDKALAEFTLHKLEVRYKNKYRLFLTVMIALNIILFFYLNYIK